MIREAGLRVSSLCRGGFFTAADEADRKEAHEDNLHALDEASALGAPTLVLVAGGLPDGDRDLPAARARATEAVAALAPEARDRGVRLGVEPMHPIFTADRGVISTLAQALDIAEQFPAEEVGVVVDTFHLWWEPGVLDQIARAGRRIASYQIGDWITPLPPDTLQSRGMVGDGHIDFASFTAAVAATGFAGDVEVEIFNADIWAAPGDRVVVDPRPALRRAGGATPDSTQLGARHRTCPEHSERLAHGAPAPSQQAQDDTFPRRGTCRGGDHGHGARIRSDGRRNRGSRPRHPGFRGPRRSSGFRGGQAQGEPR